MRSPGEKAGASPAPPGLPKTYGIGCPVDNEAGFLRWSVYAPNVKQP